MDNIDITFRNTEEFNEFIGLNLHKYNRLKCEYIGNNSTKRYNNRITFGFEVKYKDKLIGGALGYIELSWCFLEQLYLDEKYRGKEIGTKLVETIETFSKENNARGVRLDTWDFQAKGFYEKLGYNVWATFENCPPGTTNYYLKKAFDKNAKNNEVVLK